MIDMVLQFTLDLIKKSGSETSSEQKSDNSVQAERVERIKGTRYIFWGNLG